MPLLLSLLGNKWTWVALALALASGTAWVQTKRLASVKEEYAAFKATEQALGEIAAKQAAVQAAADKQRKEKADALHAKTKRERDALYDAHSKLLNSPGGGVLPAARPGAGGAADISFNRAALDSALRSFDGGVTGLLKEGDEALGGLNAAKEWAATSSR